MDVPSALIGLFYPVAFACVLWWAIAKYLAARKRGQQRQFEARAARELGLQLVRAEGQAWGGQLRLHARVDHFVIKVLRYIAEEEGDSSSEEVIIDAGGRIPHTLSIEAMPANSEPPPADSEAPPPSSKIGSERAPRFFSGDAAFDSAARVHGNYAEVQPILTPSARAALTGGARPFLSYGRVRTGTLTWEESTFHPDSVVIARIGEGLRVARLLSPPDSAPLSTPVHRLSSEPETLSQPH